MGDDGKLTIVCSTQTPFRDRMEVADVLGLEPTMVRIIVPYVGGAFGGKDGVTVQSLLGLAALHSGGRPVKMWWDREESFLAGTKRHAVRMYYRCRSQEGRLPALLECPIVSRHRPLRSSRRSCNGIGPRSMPAALIVFRTRLCEPGAYTPTILSAGPSGASELLRLPRPSSR